MSSLSGGPDGAGTRRALVAEPGRRRELGDDANPRRVPVHPRTPAGQAHWRLHGDLWRVDGVRPEDLQRAFRVWWEPDYLDLRLNGLLAKRDPAVGLEGPLVVPGAAAGIGDCVGEREEELDVPLDPMLVDTVVVAAGDELREQVPMPGRKLGVGAVRQYSAIIFCSSVSPALRSSRACAWAP